ncbi:MAG: 3-deoxy-D-manno-octulosonic acid transferase [Bacteroidia bacterium]
MWLYNTVILLYGLVIKIASVKKAKAKFWVNGRKNWREILSAKVSKLNNAPLVWIHCASYGEFEQGRPLIEAIKQSRAKRIHEYKKEHNEETNKHPDYKILVSFFSPSGYEAFKDWQGADIICYLPLDTKRNGNDFIDILKPKLVIFIKYEFWINFLFQLREKKIPTYLVSAVFKPHHPFFKWYGYIFRKSLKTFNKLLLQDDKSGELLKSIGITNYEVCGDTRFDRVLEIKQNFKPIPQIEAFKGNSQLIIAGSTWAKDEDLVLNAFAHLKEGNIKLVLVPHNIDDNHIKEILAKLKQHQLSYSLYTGMLNAEAQVLVVNTMGLLAKMYHYANCAYIGGGFNGGLHNTLEAAVYGIPLTFYGDDYTHYNEAVDLIKLGAAINITTADELADSFNTFLNNPPNELKEKLSLYFETHANVSAKVLGALGV